MISFITDPGPVPKIGMDPKELLEPLSLFPACGPLTDWGELLQSCIPTSRSSKSRPTNGPRSIFTASERLTPLAEFRKGLRRR